MALTGWVLSASAQYAIDWFKVAGGGGTSSGGAYTLSGTIGQAEAGVMSGGNFTLVGGFWGLIAAVQVEGAPLLEVRQTNGLVVVSWAQPAAGWLLQSTTALLPGGSAWTEIPPPYQTNGVANISYTEPTPLGNRFYRLHKP